MGRKNRRGVKADAQQALTNLVQQAAPKDHIWDFIYPHGNALAPKNALATVLEADNPKYDDFSATIIFTSVLEKTLEDALSLHFVSDAHENMKLFGIQEGEDHVLPNLSSKICIGYALGLYEQKMLRDLKLIRTIRNKFAHSRRHIDFRATPLRTLCGRLNIRQIFMKRLYDKNEEFQEMGFEDFVKLSDAKQNFFSALYFITSLIDFMTKLDENGKPFTYKTIDFYNGSYDIQTS